MPRVSLKVIARAVGLSKNSVAVALADKPGVSEATRARIKAAAARLGYRPNPTVAHLMTQLRASQEAHWQAKLALVNAHHDPRAFRAHPTIPTYVAGCEARAQRLGYTFDQFWLHDPEMTANAWLRILRARGIAGIVIVGLMDTNRLPPQFAPVWSAFPTVVTGVRTREPALSFACVDHHNLTLTAVERALALGYRRPGLVLDRVIDELVEERFSAGFFTAQRRLPPSRHVEVFWDLSAARHGPEVFAAWLKRAKPDVIFTLYNEVFDWLRALGRQVPRDLGVIQLEWRAARPEIAGMNQHNDEAGAAAVDLLVNQIHHGETGVQDFPRATLIGATWVDGKTVQSAVPPSKAEAERAGK